MLAHSHSCSSLHQTTWRGRGVCACALDGSISSLGVHQLTERNERETREGRVRDIVGVESPPVSLCSLADSNQSILDCATMISQGALARENIRFIGILSNRGLSTPQKGRSPRGEKSDPALETNASLQEKDIKSGTDFNHIANFIRDTSQPNSALSNNETPNPCIDSTDGRVQYHGLCVRRWETPVIQ